MMFRLEIECDSPAFGDRPELQLSGILHGVGNTLQYIAGLDNGKPIKTPITDVNGIQCGIWVLSKSVSDEAEEQEMADDRAN